MLKTIIKASFLLMLALSLISCATYTGKSPREMSILAQSKRYFDDGYYKKALHQLLPLAADGNPQAEYAIGYMYYYGLGVEQDTETGRFWVQRAADKNYPMAIEALKIMIPPDNYVMKPRDWLKR